MGSVVYKPGNILRRGCLAVENKLKYEDQKCSSNVPELQDILMPVVNHIYVNIM